MLTCSKEALHCFVNDTNVPGCNCMFRIIKICQATLQLKIKCTIDFHIKTGSFSYLSFDEFVR